VQGLSVEGDAHAGTLVRHGYLARTRLHLALRPEELGENCPSVVGIARCLTMIATFLIEPTGLLEPKFPRMIECHGGFAQKMNDPKLLLTAAALLATAIAFAMFGNGTADHTGSERGVTTETAAAAAGARVEPTDPRLRVKPK
jgi:hypothetical protein